MSHAVQHLLGRPGRLLAAFLVAAAAIVALMLSIQGSTARAEGLCFEPHFCAWSTTHFEGGEVNYPCSEESRSNGFELKSAQNLCKVNVHIGWAEGGFTNWKACMSYGGVRPEPGRFDRIVPGGC